MTIQEFIVGMIIFSLVNFLVVWFITTRALCFALDRTSKKIVEIIEMCEANDKQKLELFFKTFHEHEK